MNRLGFVASVIGVIADRILKWYVGQMPAPYAAGIFSFGQFLNPALFFFPAWRFIPWLALVVLIALAILMATHRFNKPLSPSPYPLVPILLGGASNVFDRFIFGGVIDILAIRGLGTFNLADLLIFWGLWMLIFQKRAADH